MWDVWLYSYLIWRNVHSFSGQTVIKSKTDTSTRSIIPIKGIVGRIGGSVPKDQRASGTPRVTKATIESRTTEATKISTIEEYITKTNVYKKSSIAPVSTKTYYLANTTHHKSNDSGTLKTSNELCTIWFPKYDI